MQCIFTFSPWSACELLADGVAALFGPSAEISAGHVQSICDAVAIPHIETRYDTKKEKSPYSVNLYPHPATLAKVTISKN